METATVAEAAGVAMEDDDGVVVPGVVRLMREEPFLEDPESAARRTLQRALVCVPPAALVLALAGAAAVWRSRAAGAS